MAKRKTAQELMAERNPLARKPVAPVDIYSQPPAPAEPAIPASKPAAEKEGKKPQTPKVAPRAQTKDDTEGTRPYSTYLRPSQVKGIKLRAVETDVKDQHIVQAAIDEYFEKHPL